MNRITSAPRIVVLGGINMDMIAVTPRIPSSGETVTGELFYTTPGGKGANQAVAAAKLGAEVSMVGRVGMDTFGTMLLDELTRQQIDVSGIARDHSNASGIAFILLDNQRQNRIVAVYGANAFCNVIQVEATKKALNGADALLLQLEIPMDVSLATAKYAREQGIMVVWDPAPGMAIPSSVYNAADVLTPNEVETYALTGIEIKDADSAARAATLIIDRGTPRVVIKMGGQGAYYASLNDNGYVSAFDTNVVDTVAAGDAFGAALTVALVEGKSLGDAVRYGSAAGGLAVSKAGAQEAMPLRREVEAVLSDL